jgi:hypothetical protein
VDERAVDEVRKLLFNPVGASAFSLNGHMAPKRPLTAPDQVFHLRSCCAFNYPGADLSQRRILAALGIRYVTSRAQTCCGGAPHYMGGAGFADRLLLTARNLSVIHDVCGDGESIAVTGICPTCSDSYAAALNLLSGSANRAVVNEALGRIGREVSIRKRFLWQTSLTSTLSTSTNSEDSSRHGCRGCASGCMSAATTGR